MNVPDQLNNMKQIIQNNNNLVNILVILFIVFLCVLLVFYIKSEISKRENNCKYISSQYNDGTSIATFKEDRLSRNKYFLNEYYILSAHNCCCSGNNKNDYVDICALDNCIKQGARMLDFKIYNKNNKAIVASSSDTSYKYKETYNYLEIGDVFKTIINKAFSSGTCPNYNDPLILYFRMYTSEKDVYDDLAENIQSYLSPRLLASITYSNESNGNNIFNKSMSNFMKKIIIVTHVNDQQLFDKTKLKQYTNMTSGPNSPFIQLKTSFNVNATQNVDDLIQYNKMKSTIVIPDLNTIDINYDPSTSLTSGCQFICMNFQNKDNYLTYLLDKFNNSNSAFMLKPENLRPIEVTTEPKQVVPESMNCVPKTRTQTIGSEVITYEA